MLCDLSFCVLVSVYVGEVASLKTKEKSLIEKRRTALNKILDIKGDFNLMYLKDSPFYLLFSFSFCSFFVSILLISLFFMRNVLNL